MYEMLQDIDYERQKESLEKQIKEELAPYGKYINGERALAIDKDKIMALLTSTCAKELLEERVFIISSSSLFAFPLHYDLENHFLYDPQGSTKLNYFEEFLKDTLHLPSVEKDIMASAKGVFDAIKSFVKPLEKNNKLNEAVEKLKALSIHGTKPFEDAYTEDVYQRYIDDILPIESGKEGVDPELNFFVKSLRPVVDDAVGGLTWRYGITDENELAYIKEDGTQAEVVYVDLKYRIIRLEKHNVGVERKFVVKRGTFNELEQNHTWIERCDFKDTINGIKEIEQFLENVHEYQKSKGE